MSDVWGLFDKEIKKSSTFHGLVKRTLTFESRAGLASYQLCDLEQFA